MRKPKRKMDWKGLKVRSLKPLENSLGSLPTGKFFEVVGWSKGLTLKSIPCNKCGLSLRISKVKEHSVHLLSIEENIIQLKENEKRKYIKNIYGQRYLSSS